MQEEETKKQIVIIHGGDSFSTHDEYLQNLIATEIDYDRLKPTKRWKDEVIETFQDADVLAPSMPNSSNAQFDEWRIWFEKIIPFFRGDVYLIGHSLGAMFLAKYLHQTPLKSPVKKLVLLAGGYDESAEGYGQFRIESASGLEASAEEVHFMHSKDDPVVPYEALDKYASDVPSAVVHRFSDKNHFLDASFPELIELIKQK